ncbi:MAG: hypothetical protein CM15mV49_880 [uncultured marine virus]|nr:MAG: hypothetical protein CM15mV49_880 [uncultured marine virus]
MFWFILKTMHGLLELQSWSGQAELIWFQSMGNESLIKARKL